jgi:hypothetical protein
MCEKSIARIAEPRKRFPDSELAYLCFNIHTSFLIPGRRSVLQGSEMCAIDFSYRKPYMGLFWKNF